MIPVQIQVKRRDEALILSGKGITMTTKDIIGLAIVCALAVLIITMSVVLLMGKGAWMIAGYNTSSKEEKEFRKRNSKLYLICLSLAQQIIISYT